MLSLVIATSVAGKLVWVAGVLVLLLLGAGALSRMGGARHARDLEDEARRDVDRGFRRPPDEGGLL